MPKWTLERSEKDGRIVFAARAEDGCEFATVLDQSQFDANNTEASDRHAAFIYLAIRVVERDPQPEFDNRVEMWGFQRYVTYARAIEDGVTSIREAQANA